MSVETIVCGATDGPTLTAAARASCIPTANRIVLPNNFFYIGRAIRIFMSGRISCVVATPGTARIDVCLGSAGTTIVFDTLAVLGFGVAEDFIEGRRGFEPCVNGAPMDAGAFRRGGD